jgi:hypothetical protein
MTTFRVSQDKKSTVVKSSASVTARRKRVGELQAATNDYVSKEKSRLSKEADVLQKILDGRNSGSGIQALNTEVATAVAMNDLASYLAPKAV